MIGAFAPASRQRTDLADRLFSQKLPEYESVVQALKTTTDPAPPNVAYFDLNLYEKTQHL